MDYSERNKKVAIARWKKIHERERKHIRDDKQAILYKAALCGFLAGDGCVQHRIEDTYERRQVRFFPDDEVMLNTYIKFFTYVYQKTPSIYSKENFYSVAITSKVIGKDLLATANLETKGWNIPDFVLDNQKLQIYWLKAFFSAEAYVSDEVIRIQTVNKEGMKQISQVLNSLGIETNFHTYSPKQEMYSDVYILIIAKQQAKLRYANTIGFWHSKKIAALHKALHSKTTS